MSTLLRLSSYQTPQPIYSEGDTLWGIGMVYGVSVARLAEINGLDEKAPLRIGQVIMIPPDAKNAVGKPVPEKKAETKPAASTTTTKPAASSTTTKPAASSTTKAQPVAKDGETLYYYINYKYWRKRNKKSCSTIIFRSIITANREEFIYQVCKIRNTWYSKLFVI